MRKAIFPILQAVVASVILWKIFGNPEIRAGAFRALEAAELIWLAGAVLAAACSELACAARWWIVVRAFGVPLRWRDALGYSAIGLFFSLGLPGSAGGDAVRVLHVAGRFPDKKHAAVFSVLADRFCGLAALVLALFFSLGVNHRVFFSSGYGGALVWAAVALCGGGVLMLALWWSTTWPGLSDVFQRRFPGINTHLLKSGEVFQRMHRNPRAMLAGVLLSCVSLVAHFAGYYLAGRAFGVGVDMLRVFAVMPVVDTITALPVALYGLGLREAVLVTLLGGFYGIPAAGAALMSLGGFGAQAVVALCGVFWLPFAGFPRTDRDPSKS